MKDALPILAAGGTFVGGALIGLIAGIVLSGRLGSPLLVVVGLFAGMAVGGYGAVRLLFRSP